MDAPQQKTSVVTTLEPKKADQEIAAEMLQRLRLNLLPVLATLDEIKRHGMVGQFGLGLDSFGRNVIQHIGIVKPLA